MYSFYVSKCKKKTITFLHDVCHPKSRRLQCAVLYSTTVIVSVFLFKMRPVFNNYIMATFLVNCIKFSEFKELYAKPPVPIELSIQTYFGLLTYFVE